MKKVNDAAAESPAMRSDSADRPQILYVEDEDDNWDVAKLRLRDKFRLHRARTDREACNKLTTLGPELSAILMDIELKGSQLDGVALTQLVRGRFVGIVPEYARAVPTLAVPVLFVTAYAWSVSADELMEAGGDSLITKPVDFVGLSMALARISASKVLGD